MLIDDSANMTQIKKTDSQVLSRTEPARHSGHLIDHDSGKVNESSSSKQNHGSLETNQTDRNRNKTFKAFSEYMDRAKGKSHAAAGGNSLEALKARLKELQNKLASVAGNTSMPKQTKTSMLNAIQTELSEVMAQIAELKASIPE